MNGNAHHQQSRDERGAGAAGLRPDVPRAHARCGDDGLAVPAHARGFHGKRGGLRPPAALARVLVRRHHAVPQVRGVQVQRGPRPAGKHLADAVAGVAQAGAGTGSGVQRFSGSAVVEKRRKQNAERRIRTRNTKRETRNIAGRLSGMARFGRTQMGAPRARPRRAPATGQHAGLPRGDDAPLQRRPRRLPPRLRPAAPKLERRRAAARGCRPLLGPHLPRRRGGLAGVQTLAPGRGPRHPQPRRHVLAPVRRPTLHRRHQRLQPGTRHHLHLPRRHHPPGARTARTGNRLSGRCRSRISPNPSGEWSCHGFIFNRRHCGVRRRNRQ